MTPTSAVERPFLTPKQVATQLAISDRSMRTMLADATIPSYKVGGSRRVDPKDLDEYLERHRKR